jgi:DNA polymerase IIIc chi subunit
LKEINFYCIEEDFNLFLYSFLFKLINNDKRVLIYIDSQDNKIENLNSFLWSHRKTDFLPHLLDTDKGAKETPIVISKNKINKNNADFLLITDFIDDKDFLDSFEKIFYLYSPINIKIRENSKNVWENYKKMDYELVFLKKDLGKWVKSTNFICN